MAVLAAVEALEDGDPHGLLARILLCWLRWVVFVHSVGWSSIAFVRVVAGSRGSVRVVCDFGFVGFLFRCLLDVSCGSFPGT